MRRTTITITASTQLAYVTLGVSVGPKERPTMRKCNVLRELMCSMLGVAPSVLPRYGTKHIMTVTLLNNHTMQVPETDAFARALINGITLEQKEALRRLL